jgi:predicted O-methyltransferase YrrM
VRRPQIDGWTTDAEAVELARLAAGRMVLEVGAYKGFGTVLMAQAGARVWAVDWHRGDSGGDAPLGPQDTLCAWWTNLRRHHLEDQVVGLVGRSQDVLPLLRAHSFDMAFIDADHSYASVKADALMCRALVRPDGLLVFHDYDPQRWPGVVQAVHEEGAFRVVGSLAIVETGSSRDS